MSNSVKKGFEIIGCIAEKQGQLTLSDISRQLGLNKTTVFRYLETMADLNILERHENCWHLGIGLFELGNKVDFPASLVNHIHPVLDELSRRLNETVNFAGLFGSRALYLDKIKSNRGLQMRSKPGEELPLYCTGLGKVILAEAPENTSNKILETINFFPLTEHTIMDKETLILELEKVKKQNYALDLEEYEAGLTCIAVPLILDQLKFTGAISISGTSARYTEDMIEQLLSELQKTKQRIYDLNI